MRLRPRGRRRRRRRVERRGHHGQGSAPVRTVGLEAKATHRGDLEVEWARELAERPVDVPGLAGLPLGGVLAVGVARRKGEAAAAQVLDVS